MAFSTSEFLFIFARLRACILAMNEAVETGENSNVKRDHPLVF